VATLVLPGGANLFKDRVANAFCLRWHVSCFVTNGVNCVSCGKKRDKVRTMTAIGAEANLKRILIVDDEQLLLQGLEKALRTAATEVTTAETAEAALTEIAATPCELCFLDVFLPDRYGTEILPEIRTISPKTRVVVMTAGVISNAMKETIEKNAYMFITKPFDLLQVRMLAKRGIEESESDVR
jgi:CheY-like chemotaxis protein